MDDVELTTPTWTSTPRSLLVKRVGDARSWALAAILLCPASVTAQSVAVPEIASALQRSVVSISARNERGAEIATGTGFVVEAAGSIVTNYHVVAGADQIAVKLPSGEVFDRVYVVATDRLRDLIILKISAGRLVPIGLGDDDAVRVGERIYVMGNPLGLARTFSDGLVSSRRLLRGTQYIQITAPISSGSSGGPVVNSKGEVVGVAALQLSEGQNLNLAIPSRYVRYLLEGPRGMQLFSRAIAPADEDRRTSNAEAKEGGDEWEAAARRHLDNWIGRARDLFSHSHEVVTGALSEGEHEDVEFTLDRGKSYFLIGTCDDDCSDIDLAVLDGNRKEISSDANDNDTPVVEVTVSRSGTFYLRVHMYKCTSSPCRYAVTAGEKR